VVAPGGRSAGPAFEFRARSGLAECHYRDDSEAHQLGESESDDGDLTIRTDLAGVYMSMLVRTTKLNRPILACMPPALKKL
jgi:hypothetical protein